MANNTFLQLLACLVVLTSTVYSESTRGKDFLLAFFPEWSSPPTDDIRNSLYISSKSNGNCTIKYGSKSGRQRKSVSVTSSTITRVGLVDSTQMTIGTKIQTLGIRVTCSVDVSLYGFNQYYMINDAADSFLILPVPLLSTEYIVPSIPSNPFLGVVVGDDNIQISIKLHSTCSYTFNSKVYNTGDTIHATLNSFDVFQISGNHISNNSTCDHGGTYITSSSPVAVFSGSMYSFRGYSGVLVYAGFHMIQVPPISLYSKLVIIPQIPEHEFNLAVRVLSSQNGTSIKMTTESRNVSNDKVTNIHLQAGQYKDMTFQRDYNIILESNNPIAVVENSVFEPYGGVYIHIPGTALYDKEYLITRLEADHTSTDGLQATFITNRADVDNIHVNARRRSDIKWTNLRHVPYSVGSVALHSRQNYDIRSSSPFLLRVHELLAIQTYGFIAGFQKPASVATPASTTTPAPTEARNSIRLSCLHAGWFVVVDTSSFSPALGDPSHIYMNVQTCTGVMGNNGILTFNTSYDDCLTKSEIVNGILVYKSSLMYAVPSPSNLQGVIQWKYDLKCTKLATEIDFIHIYPQRNETEREITGEIQGQLVDITLYKDTSFAHPFLPGLLRVPVGSSVYVKVASPPNQNTIMVVNTCNVLVGRNRGSEIKDALIQNGCAVGKGTNIFVTRNHMTLFKFDMISLYDDIEGVYVTCDVRFCDISDFSPSCQQRCHSTV